MPVSEKRQEYLDRTRDKRLAQMRARYERKREEVLAKQAAWRQANPNAYMRWARENPDKTRRRDMTRRARKLGQFVEVVDPRTLWEVYGGRCGICSELIQPDAAFHVDHIVPLSKGGMHGYVNCQPAHPICNLKKGARV